MTMATVDDTFDLRRLERVRPVAVPPPLEADRTRAGARHPRHLPGARVHAADPARDRRLRRWQPGDAPARTDPGRPAPCRPSTRSTSRSCSRPRARTRRPTVPSPTSPPSTRRTSDGHRGAQGPHPLPHHELHAEIARRRRRPRPWTASHPAPRSRPSRTGRRRRKRSLLDAEGPTATGASARRRAPRSPPPRPGNAAVEIELRDAEARLPTRAATPSRSSRTASTAGPASGTPSSVPGDVRRQRTAVLGTTVDSERAFTAAQRTAHDFLGTYAAERRTSTTVATRPDARGVPAPRPRADPAAGAPVARAPPGCDAAPDARARLAMARAAGIDPSRLPFVAELLDVLPARSAGAPRSSPSWRPSPGRCSSTRTASPTSARRSTHSPPARARAVRGRADRAAHRRRRRPVHGVRQARHQAVAVQHLGAGADRVRPHRRPVRRRRLRTRRWRPSCDRVRPAP